VDEGIQENECAMRTSTSTSEQFVMGVSSDVLAIQRLPWPSRIIMVHGTYYLRCLSRNALADYNLISSIGPKLCDDRNACIRWWEQTKSRRSSLAAFYAVVLNLLSLCLLRQDAITG